MIYLCQDEIDVTYPVILSQANWNNYSVVFQDQSVNDTQLFPKIQIFCDQFRTLECAIWPSSVDGLHK